MTYKEKSATICVLNYEQQQKHNGTISIFKMDYGI